MLPLASRFLDERLVEQEPLVPAAAINHDGELVNCETSWVMEAWRKTRA
ncbi:MAG: hypothetical protein ONB42_02025 [candidate division KSB1 bacterium]|nr:hypothetical protein [candidate division KSB1 bacterium]